MNNVGFSFVLILLIFVCAPIASYKNAHFWEGRNTIIHLFEWKWDDIAEECERFLQHKGYGGVQISPPNENLVISKRPWWERYQPVSYKLITRSGNEQSFANMVKRCNAVGIRIYVDAVINHMSAGDGIGTGGSNGSSTEQQYPAVPYGPRDFNQDCGITNYDDNTNSRNCRLVGLLDLNQSKNYVRNKIVEFLNHLIDLGVAGFRIDAARHIWPGDLNLIISRLKNLNVEFGFPKHAKPFIYQEISNMDVKEYIPFGTVIEFRYSRLLGNIFRRNDKLRWLINWGPEWGLVDGLDAVAFIDNHDNQRDRCTNILTHREAKQYKMATAFMLAHPYGTTRIMSSYHFENFDEGPPSDTEGNIRSPEIDKNNTCTNGWVCEHRWSQIYNMVQFRNVVSGTALTNWWSNNENQISFCRGEKGFVALTNCGDINQDLQTCLSAGRYCDIISGEVVRGNCTGKYVDVRSDGMAHISLPEFALDGVLAIHVNAKLN